MSASAQLACQPSPASPSSSKSRILYSWKEIAGFLKCGVRTAQRWEQDEGLPTHRHNPDRCARVFALESEILDWLRSREASSTVPSPSNLAPTFRSTRRLDLLSLICSGARQRATRVRGVFQPYNSPSFYDVPACMLPRSLNSTQPYVRVYVPRDSGPAQFNGFMKGPYSFCPDKCLGLGRNDSCARR